MQINKLTQMYEEQQDESIGKQYEVNFLKGELGQQPLVIIGEKEFQKQQQASWGWILLFVMGTIGGFYLPQSGIPQIATMNPLYGVMIIDAILAIIKYWYDQNQQTVVERLRQNTMNERTNVTS